MPVAQPLSAAPVPPPSSSVNLNGKLNSGTLPATGEHEFRYRLFTDATGNTPVAKTQTIVTTANITAGNWQTALDLRRFGGEKSILDNTVFPPDQAVSILDNTVIPTIGDRAILDNTFRTSLQQNWRSVEGGWLEISVRKKGTAEFVPLSPRQQLTAVPRAGTAFSAEHAVVAGSVTEGGVDARALAPGIITAEKITAGAIDNRALANLAITAPKIAPLTVVRSLNGLRDEVTLAAGTGVSLRASGNTITIDATATGGGGGSPPLPRGNFLGADNDNLFGGSATHGVIGGGSVNKISDDNSYSVVGGGQLNRIYERSSWSFLGGGYNQQVGPDAAYATLGGGYSHVMTNGNSATIAGGYQNVTGGSFATIGGGASNFAVQDATVAGGSGNRAEGAHSVIGGGSGNSVLAPQSVVGGGVNNAVENSADGTISGGGGNRLLNSAHSTIGGGDANRVVDSFGSVVAGGLGNVVASQASAILGGQENRIEGTQGYATVLGGSLNLAAGMHSLAAGTRASATHNGSFVWNAWPGRSDSVPFISERDGEFAARAYGGFRFVTAGTDVGAGDITLDAGDAALRASGKSANFNFGQSFSVTAGGGVNFTTGGKGLFVDGQKVATGTASGGGGGQSGTGPIVVSTGGGQAEPQVRIEQTNPDDYVRIMANTPRSFWTFGAGGPDGSFSFYVPGQSPANTVDAGANRFIITPNGEVGVGSDRPFGQFHVRGRGGFDLPQIRATQQNPQDFARLRLETGKQAWDIAAGPDGSLRFFGGGADRLVLGTDGVRISTGAAGLSVNGRPVAYADQLGQGGGQGGTGGAVSATVAQGVAVSAVSEDQQGGVGVSATGRVGVRATSSSAQGAALQAIQLNGSGYAGDFAGKVKVSSTLEANGGVRVTGAVNVSGAGDNTPTAAFRLLPDRLTVVSGNVPGSFPTLLAVIDHPSLNERPDALLMLTPVNAGAYKLMQRNSDVMRGDFLRYVPSTDTGPAAMRGRWVVDITPVPPGIGQPTISQLAVFNALVVTP